MDNQLSDKTVITIIISTILLIFLVVFATIPNNRVNQPEMEWKDSPLQTTLNKTDLNSSFI